MKDNRSFSEDEFKQKYLKYKIKYHLLTQKMATIVPMRGGGNSQEDKIQIQLYKAEWCGHCTRFKSSWEQLKNKYNKKFNFITYDYNKDSDKMEQMKIDSFPTILFKEGDKIMPYTGPKEYDVLDSILHNLVKSN